MLGAVVEVGTPQQSLETAIKEAYAALQKSGRLSGSILGNDITDTVSKYIVTGMSFELAEHLLKAANLNVLPRPSGTNRIAGTNRIEREDIYDVYAVSSNLIKSSSQTTSIEVRVSIRPKNPATYDQVGALRAVIIVTSI